ncbi:hypothetical protein [Sulfitobacter aestuariivivens]|uniref:Uncharacterized protein n=1 Tax=Sulfitobacter aestuariivivens TaxID=2766981 RepID=A0A927DB43_9RHOB|nr:hypothetical protein [Sulfitobacter aestuariivivens]MBD3666016.1 hypothetical protein [Sulfitobacter aestuariivivens]
MSSFEPDIPAIILGLSAILLLFWSTRVEQNKKMFLIIGIAMAVFSIVSFIA